jgi:hypothetical protein
MCKSWILFWLALVGAPAWSQSLDFSRLEWLQGNWVGEHEGGLLEESWSPSRGLCLLGFSRMVSNGTTVHKEFLCLEGDCLRLILPQPDGSTRSLSMKLKQQLENSLTFVDAAHTEQLEYRSIAPGQLEITLSKKDKTVFRLRRSR